MPSTYLYLGTPGAGKSTLMRSHVDALLRQPEPPVFFIVDHGSPPGKPPTWESLGVLYDSPSAWWRAPSPIARFHGGRELEVAQLAIDVGWSCYVDDEAELALGEKWATNPLREIVKRGLHIQNRAGLATCVTALLGSQRPSNFPPDVRGCFERVYVGRLQSFADAKHVYYEGWLRGLNVQSPQDALAVLQDRRPGEFTVWP